MVTRNSDTEQGAHTGDDIWAELFLLYASGWTVADACSDDHRRHHHHN